jgi:hypothetical protein
MFTLKYTYIELRVPGTCHLPTRQIRVISLTGTGQRQTTVTGQLQMTGTVTFSIPSSLHAASDHLYCQLFSTL